VSDADTHYTFAIEDDASLEDVLAVEQGLDEYNRAFTQSNYKRLAIFLRDRDGRLIGGLTGDSDWGWLHIRIFWLEEAARRQGFGTRLLALAEEEGRRRGCRYAWLDTFSFQARPFYEKTGYEVFAIQEDYPVGHTRWFLKKTL
jgi:GNAT superfamily N-acetyltransferase